MSETIILESIIEQLRKENAELKQSQSQKQKIKMYDRITELENINNALHGFLTEKIDECLALRVQNKELIEFVKYVANNDDLYNNFYVANELLNKYKEK